MSCVLGEAPRRFTPVDATRTTRRDAKHIELSALNAIARKPISFSVCASTPNKREKLSRYKKPLRLALCKYAYHAIAETPSSPLRLFPWKFTITLYSERKERNYEPFSQVYAEKWLLWFCFVGTDWCTVLKIFGGSQNALRNNWKFLFSGCDFWKFYENRENTKAKVDRAFHLILRIQNLIFNRYWIPMF